MAQSKVAEPKARGKRTIAVPSTDLQKKKWRQSLDKTKSHVVKENGEPKRKQIDTWAVVDDWGFTPEEFRLLYCIARHENWKTLPGGQAQQRQNGCYASAEKLRQITGISRNKIFEILSLFQAANILKREQARGRAGAIKGKGTLAGWTYEYTIMPIDKWAPPWEMAELREKLLQQKKSKQPP